LTVGRAPSSALVDARDGVGEVTLCDGVADEVTAAPLDPGSSPQADMPITISKDVESAARTRPVRGDTELLGSGEG
jgi:hypothetical protein